MDIRWSFISKYNNRSGQYKVKSSNLFEPMFKTCRIVFYKHVYKANFIIFLIDRIYTVFLDLGYKIHIFFTKKLYIYICYICSIIWFKLKCSYSLLASNECITIISIHYFSKNYDWKKYFIVLVIVSS